MANILNWLVALVGSLGITLSSAFSGVVIQKDIPYGDLEKQKLDLCEPKGLTGKVPGVILIHGGQGDKSSFMRACRKLAKKGLVAISVNFREEPPPSYKVVLADNQKALAWLKARPEVDNQKIGAMGGSLGGYVSSMLGTVEGSDKVQCVNNNFGPTDFTDPSEWEGSSLAEEFVEKFFGGVTYDEDPQLYRDLSPITHVSSNDAGKWLFTRSTNDSLVPRTQMTKMIDKLKTLGIQTEFIEYDGTGGGHANKLPALEALKLLNQKVNFLVSCLKS